METKEINIMSKGEIEDGALIDDDIVARETFYDEDIKQNLKRIDVDDSKFCQKMAKNGRNYTRSDYYKVERTLLVYGWERWEDMLDHACFQDPYEIEDVINIARTILTFSLLDYETKNTCADRKVTKLISDLIFPKDDIQNNCKNHDLSKRDIDVDGLISDKRYRRHLELQSQKEISLPIDSADVDLPIFWWDEEADKSLLVGVFKHGYEQYNLMRSDPCLCFLSRCGPPDRRAILAERKSQARELRKEEEDYDKYGMGGISDNEESDDEESGGGMTLEPGKLRFPIYSDLNIRLRRLITSHQRNQRKLELQQEREDKIRIQKKIINQQN